MGTIGLGISDMRQQLEDDPRMELLRWDVELLTLRPTKLSDAEIASLIVEHAIFMLSLRKYHEFWFQAAGVFSSYRDILPYVPHALS